MNNETKEVLQIVDKVFMCPAGLLEKDEALDKIMETYVKNREGVLKQLASAEGKGGYSSGIDTWLLIFMFVLLFDKPGFNSSN